MEDNIENLITDFDAEMIMSSSATNVGFSAMETLMNYYAEMLVALLGEVAELTGSDRRDVRDRLEQELGLVGVMDNSFDQLAASTEIIKLIIEKSGHEFPEDFNLFED